MRMKIKALFTGHLLPSTEQLRDFLLTRITAQFHEVGFLPFASQVRMLRIIKGHKATADPYAGSCGTFVQIRKRSLQVNTSQEHMV